MKALIDEIIGSIFNEEKNMDFNKSIEKIIDIANECGIVEEEYAQTQLELLVQKAIELQRHMDNMYWSERCNLLSHGKVCSEKEVNQNYRRLKYALGAVYIPLVIISAQLNLDPAECFKLAIDDLEKCDIEG